MEPSSFSSNGSFTPLSPTALDAFIPGYTFISKFILDTFAFDVGSLVTAGVLIFAITKFFDTVGDKIRDQFWRFFTCSVAIDHNDDMFEDLMKWFAAQRATAKARQIKIAKPSLISNRMIRAWKASKETSASATEDSTILHDFRNDDAKQPLYYLTDFGSHYFWHKGRLFFLDRSQIEQRGFMYRDDDPKEQITLKCIGRSTQPIKNLLEDIRLQELEEQDHLTKIRRPEPPDNANQPCPGYWRRVAKRPCRPLSTVTLETEQKRKILRDINDYVSPSKPRWYSARGIPYRRGYLFSGPPGTGKTSLSFALAGVFGMDLHVVSLNDSSITEESLTTLFNNLPDHCVVLLEDIDSAGINRQNVSGSIQGTTEDDKDPEDMSLLDVAKALKTQNQSSSVRIDNSDKPKGITLSGLLNAIDGVASHEGHVLIMTTNNPENLDEALKRPGRVDMHVQFTLATKGQAREIFVRMFIDEKSDDDSVAKKPKSLGPKTVDDLCSPVTLNENHICHFMSIDELEKLADKFIEYIPEQKLSPAEIQGFLLMHKSEPEKALEVVEEWIQELMMTKKNPSKAKEVEPKKTLAASSPVNQAASDSTYESDSSDSS